VSLLKEVLTELYKMFLGDIGLAAAVCAVVLITVALIKWIPGVNTVAIGYLFFAGCLVVLIAVTSVAALRSRRS
jgi:type IV secretory pathway VirB2 component (pilin)